MKNHKSILPRKAVKVSVTWLIDTSASKAGEHDIIRKDDAGWHMSNEKGDWAVPVALLRNTDVCRIDEILEAAA